MTGLEQEIIRLTHEAELLTDEELLDAFEHESSRDAYLLDPQERTDRFHILRKEALQRMARGKGKRSES